MKLPAAHTSFLLAALLLAGCALPGGVQRETIRFGATISITGLTAKEGEAARDGYLLFVETINAQGGMQVGTRRYPVELRYYDDESRPERSSELYEKLVREDKVDFLLGPYGSGPTAAAAAVAEAHGIPLIEGNGSADSIFANGYHNVFGIMTPASSYLSGVIDLALAANPPMQRVAILQGDDPFSQATAEGAASYASQHGMQVVARERYPTDTTNLSAQLAVVASAQPELVLGATHLQDALLIVRQMKASGFAPRAVGFSVGPASPTFRKTLRADADYVFGSAQWTAALNYQGNDMWGSAAAFAAAFEQRYPDYRSVPYTAACSAASMVAFQQAIAQAGSLEPASVRDAIASLSIDTFFGHIQFDTRGLNSTKAMAIEQLQPDGMQYTVYPEAMAERPALFAKEHNQ